MLILRTIALATFIAGVSLLVAGFVRTQGGPGSPTPEPFVPLQATPTRTPTPSPTDAPTPTPSPTPFNGAIARFKIPRFNVDAGIETIGVLPDNTLDSPHNPRNVGWYDLPAFGVGKPGFGGNVLFSAHVDYYPNILGPFNKLAKLELDDEVAVVMENGIAYTYRVISRDQYSLAEIRMGEIMAAKARPPDREWITMITCGGEFTPLSPGGPGTYGSRVVVVAERVK